MYTLPRKPLRCDGMVVRVKLDAKIAASQHLRGQEGGTGAGERVFCGVVRYVASAPIVEGMPASCSG